MSESKSRPVSDAAATPPSPKASKISYKQKLVAELFGTFFLTLTAAGPGVIAAATGQSNSAAAGAVAPGLLLMAMIYSIGGVSGCHINPAVTFGFAVRGNFPWRKVPEYWFAQIVGALFAAMFLAAAFGVKNGLGLTQPAPATGGIVALLMEFVLTLLFVFVIIGTAQEGQSIGANAALAVGGTLALIGLFAAGASGASLNPARSLGPAIMLNKFSFIWVYIAGPLAGAAAAAFADRAIHGVRPPSIASAAGAPDDARAK